MLQGGFGFEIDADGRARHRPLVLDEPFGAAEHASRRASQMNDDVAFGHEP